MLSTGLTWRQLAEVLKALRWDREYVRELGLDPDDLPPRERSAILVYVRLFLLDIDTPEAAAAADKLAGLVKSLGYVVTKPSTK